MASPSNNPYTFQRASTTATRSLISSTKPTETPSSSSNDFDDAPGGKATLQRKTTNHYEQAAAAATKAGQMPATTAGSAAASVAQSPQRQQSWKMSDFKGQQQGQMLAGGTSGGRGYSSTQK